MLRPIHEFIAVKVDVQEKSVGGIVLPNADRTEGVVVAVNKDSQVETGRRVKLQEHRGVPFEVTDDMRKGLETYLNKGDHVLMIREDKIFGYLDGD